MISEIQNQYIEKIIGDLNMAKASLEEQKQTLEMVAERFERVVVITFIRMLTEPQKQQFNKLLETHNNSKAVEMLASEVPGLDVAIEQALLTEYSDLKSGMS